MKYKPKRILDFSYMNCNLHVETYPSDLLKAETNQCLDPLVKPCSIEGARSSAPGQVEILIVLPFSGIYGLMGVNRLDIYG